MGSSKRKKYVLVHGYTRIWLNCTDKTMNPPRKLLRDDMFK
ncbi:hypothetical protein Gotur_004395 [Gossypium turneri]